MIPPFLHVEKIMEEIHLPTGIEIKQILENEFAPEDIGHALQFLEFCRVFEKVCLYYQYYNSKQQIKILILIIKPYISEHSAEF
jgi:hypothetical protein